MHTNQDLYKSIDDLIRQKEDQPIPSLEQYLINLLHRATQVAHKEALTLEEFYLLLRDSFEGVDDASKTISAENAVPQFAELKLEVCQQIQDLREMAENKQLEGEYIYFGIDAPSGNRWYNFDPCTYIECGVRGSFGGCEPVWKSKEVVRVDMEGSISPVDPNEPDPPPDEIPCITWDNFTNFVYCGRIYE